MKMENYDPVDYVKDIDIRYDDRFAIKNKIKQGQYTDLDTLRNVLGAYKILLLQKEDQLFVLKSLETKIQFLPHQIYGALRIKNDFGGRGLLADEVGLGKTIEAGILIKEYIQRGLVRTVLILTPSTLVTQWKGEMQGKFDMHFVAASKYDKAFEGFDRHDQLICSIDTAKGSSNAPVISKRDWDMVIVDEAHRLKNERTRNYQFVRSLPKKYFLLLTATPIQNNLKELYNLVDVIKPGLLGTWTSFESNYIADNKARIIRADTRERLQNILMDVVIRTRREEVRSYLTFTNRIPQTHRLTPSPEEKELYDKLTSFLKGEYQTLKTNNTSPASIFSLMILQRQLTSSTSAVIRALRRKIISEPHNRSNYEHFISLANKIKEDTKMQKLKEIIRNNPKTKYLIFTSFLATQDYIANYFDDKGLGVVKYSGTINTLEKDLAISKFKRDIQIMISTEAGSEGKNFQFCNTVINYDLPWNPMKVEQRVGRVHRIGQQHDVIIHNLSLVNTIEDYILTLLYEKIKLFQMTIGDIDLLFEDQIKMLPKKIFDTYMSSYNEKDAINKFAVLTKELLDKHAIAESVQQFDKNVFQNFDLSPMSEVKEIVR